MSVAIRFCGSVCRRVLQANSLSWTQQAGVSLPTQHLISSGAHTFCTDSSRPTKDGLHEAGAESVERMSDEAQNASADLPIAGSDGGRRINNGGATHEWSGDLPVSSGKQGMKAELQPAGGDVPSVRTAPSVGVDTVVEHLVKRRDQRSAAGAPDAAGKDATTETLVRDAVEGTVGASVGAAQGVAEEVLGSAVRASTEGMLKAGEWIGYAVKGTSAETNDPDK